MSDDLVEYLKQSLTESHRRMVKEPACDDALDKLFARVVVEIGGCGVSASILADKLKRYAAIAQGRK